jgi:hypothetical protein
MKHTGQLKEKYEAWFVAVEQLNTICDLKDTGLVLAIACKAVDDASLRLGYDLKRARNKGDFQNEVASKLKVSVYELRELIDNI